ncbi:MAG: hypothetical protein IJ833_02720 [Lachnospiraceae bacterium]|nr:hypothetical protein [Lachnospiraceae bacterium]
MKLRAFIPHYMPNGIVLTAYGLLACFKPSVKTVQNNAEWNSRLLGDMWRHLLVNESGFIECQADWKDVRFGKKGVIAKSGCGIIATGNALAALEKRDVGASAMVELISVYERRGAALGGKFGVSPRAIARYFRELGYEVSLLHSRNPQKINQLGQNSDAIIAVVYNDADDIMEQLHTVCVTKEKGNYFLHNAGGTSPDIGYNNLQEGLEHISKKRVLPIAVIGIQSR